MQLGESRGKQLYHFANYKENTGRFMVFSVTTNISNKKTKGLILMEIFTATGKLKTFFFPLQL
jgi:hypothetical protein